jgi:hypothetical protein
MNIPGLEGINIDEILGRLPRSRPPLNTPRPAPDPVVAAQPSPKELPPVFKGAGRGNAPRVINIPGLGPIEIPQAFESPEQIESLFDEEDVIEENPVIGERPDGSPVLLYDDDSDDYLDYEEDEPDPSQPVEPPLPVETQPVEPPLPVEETQPIQAPPPPDPFKDYVPRNILGTSFDPKDVSAQQKMVAEARARQTPGANIQGGGYLTYDNPLLGNKQTQFGGYGQPMSAKPLMNYAGLASPVRYSSPVPNPGAQPGGPPPPPDIIT